MFLLIQKLSRRSDSDRTARHGAMAPRHHNIDNPAYDANTVKQVCVIAVAHCDTARCHALLRSHVACLGPKQIIAIGLPVYTVLAPISALYGDVASMPLVSCGGVAKAQRVCGCVKGRGSVRMRLLSTWSLPVAPLSTAAQ